MVGWLVGWFTIALLSFYLQPTDYHHCSVWSRRNWRTFDGFVHTFDNGCEFILAILDEMLTIKFITHKDCTLSETEEQNHTGTTMIEFDFEWENSIYLLHETEGGGAWQSGQRLKLPYKGSDMNIVAMNKYIVVKLESYGWSVLYDSKDYVSIVVMEENNVETARGLCGKCDEHGTEGFVCQFDQTTKDLYSKGTIGKFYFCLIGYVVLRPILIFAITDSSIFKISIPISKRAQCKKNVIYSVSIMEGPLSIGMKHKCCDICSR